MFKKLRLRNASEVLAADAISRRFKPQRQASTDGSVALYDNESTEWHSEHDNFAKQLWDISKAKVVMLVGKRKVRRFRENFPDAVSVNTAETRMCGGKTCVWLILDGPSIKHIVIPSYHPEYFFYSASLNEAQLTDVLRNLVTTITQHKNIYSGYFLWRLQTKIDSQGTVQCGMRCQETP